MKIRSLGVGASILMLFCKKKINLLCNKSYFYKGVGISRVSTLFKSAPGIGLLKESETILFLQMGKMRYWGWLSLVTFFNLCHILELLWFSPIEWLSEFFHGTHFLFHKCLLLVKLSHLTIFYKILDIAF